MLQWLLALVFVILIRGYVTYKLPMSNPWNMAIVAIVLGIRCTFCFSHSCPRQETRWTMPLALRDEQVSDGSGTEDHTIRDAPPGGGVISAPDAPRARDLGADFEGTTGEWNSITDVPGVEVGYVTLIEGDGELKVGAGPVRTGVTVVLPLGRDGVGRSCPAGWFSLNGNGEMTGTAWLDEVGALSLPVGITNTHAIGAVHRGILEWSIRNNPELASRWQLPVVAETWDGYLNDINGRHVTPEATWRALDAATSGPIAEGSVGGGTGMNCYAFKGGTGTASRRVRVGTRIYNVGTLMQANFGSRKELTISGLRLGEVLREDNPMEHGDRIAPSGAGSCITIVATDAPLLPGQCKALARRVSLGLARTGTIGSHFSGDLFLAFSTTNVGMLDSSIRQWTDTGLLPSLEFVPWGLMDVLYEAVVQCVEETVINVLVAGRTMIGRDGHRSPGFPVERLPDLLSR
jgi:D-aminopeptidase